MYSRRRRALGPAFLVYLATMNAKKDTKPFAIRRLEANQIGPFAHLEMDFPEKQIEGKAEIHILTGENGTGKSTVLQMLANCVPSNTQILHKKIWANRNADFKVQFFNKSFIRYNCDPISTHLNNFKDYTFGFEEKVISEYVHPVEQWFYGDEQGMASNGFFAYSGYRKLTDSTVESISELKSNPFENVLDFDKSTNTKTFVNWLANTITKNALARVKGSFEDIVRGEIYNLPIAQLAKVIANITGQSIKFELQESPLAILIHVDRQPLEFDQLPDGMKSIVSWLGDLIMRLDRIKWSTPEPLLERNFILFLDEIEIHLHPTWQRKILPVVQQLFPNAQIFISTHSPFVVGSVDGAWVHRFVRDEQGHSRLLGEPILSEDSNSYEYILSEIFGVTERFGVDVERDLQEFKTIKNKILRSDLDYDTAHFEQLIQKLMSQSAEIQSIIGMELRQISRLTNQSFA